MQMKSTERWMKLNPPYFSDKVGFHREVISSIKDRFSRKENRFCLLTKAVFFSGAGDEARTRYLHLGKVALYRMSYTRGTSDIIALIFILSTRNFAFFKKSFFWGARGLPLPQNSSILLFLVQKPCVSLAVLDAPGHPAQGRRRNISLSDNLVIGIALQQ